MVLCCGCPMCCSVGPAEIACGVRWPGPYPAPNPSSAGGAKAAQKTIHISSRRVHPTSNVCTAAVDTPPPTHVAAREYLLLLGLLLLLLLLPFPPLLVPTQDSEMPGAAKPRHPSTTNMHATEGPKPASARTGTTQQAPGPAACAETCRATGVLDSWSSEACFRWSMFRPMSTRLDRVTATAGPKKFGTVNDFSAQHRKIPFFRMHARPALFNFFFHPGPAGEGCRPWRPRNAINHDSPGLRAFLAKSSGPPRCLVGNQHTLAGTRKRLAVDHQQLAWTRQRTEGRLHALRTRHDTSRWWCGVVSARRGCAGGVHVLRCGGGGVPSVPLVFGVGRALTPPQSLPPSGARSQQKKCHRGVCHPLSQCDRPTEGPPSCPLWPTVAQLLAHSVANTRGRLQGGMRLRGVFNDFRGCRAPPPPPPFR